MELSLDRPRPAQETRSGASEIKRLIREQDWASALSMIRGKLSSESDPDAFFRYGNCLTQIPLEASALHGVLGKRVAILGGYTTSFASKALVAALFKRGVHAHVWESEYGLFEHAVRAGEPSLIDFKPDLCHFAVSSENLIATVIENEVARWQDLWRTAHARLTCPVVQTTFQEPLHRIHGNFELKNPRSRTRFIRELNLRLADQAPGFVHFVDGDFLSAWWGRKDWRDEKFYDLAKLPTSAAHLIADAENTAAVMAAVFGRSKKCLVLDLDNTLWGGVVGDDGLGGIKIGDDSDVGESFKRFQTYIRGLKDRGVILAVCSKNEEANAKEPFAKRTDMVLRLSDFSAFVANWDPKHLNVERIARELNIGLDSMVFVDDNPAEREIVRQHLPEVTVLELPTDPALYTTALAHGHFFETVSITDEDLSRTAQYRANQEREILQNSTSSYADYLKTLHMRAVVEPFAEDQWPRITQLIGKTNQFNLTTRRYSETDVAAFSRDSMALTLYVKLADRFGDNGLISVFIARQVTDEEFKIDTWLMSCRVLKRDVERLVLNEVVDRLEARGIKRLSGEYLPTKKNGLVQGLLPDLGFQTRGSEFVLEISQARAQRQAVAIEVVQSEHYGGNS